MKSANCLNCGSELLEKDQFCSSCGQSANVHRISLGHIFHDGLHYFLHADKSIFTLVKSLAVKTGFVARDYIAGRRKKYYPPLNFFLLVIGLVVLSMAVFHMYEKQTSISEQQFTKVASEIANPMIKAKFLGLMHRQQTAMRVVKNYSNIISMCAAPLMALIFGLFYRKKYNYAEHLTAILYCVGFTSLIFGLVFIPLMSIGNQTFYFSVLIAYFVFEIIYRSVFYYRFINQAGPEAVFKSIAVSILSWAIWTALSVSLVYWYIKSGMGGLFH